jgi:CHAT domain-containing protein
MQHSTMIHVPSYGEFDESHPFASFLPLASDRHSSSAPFPRGHLTAAEIFDHRIPADLVALSACQISAGNITGDGVLGMTRAFFVAGAASVIAAQWAVADKPSDWLMTRFYRNMQRGMSKEDALRPVQLSLIADLRSGRLTIKTPLGPLPIPESPRFWAAFVLERNP